MKQVVVCSECRNIYLRREGEERCPFCVGAPGEVIMDIGTMTEVLPLPEPSPETPSEGKPGEKVEEVSLPAMTERKPKAERKRGK